MPTARSSRACPFPNISMHSTRRLQTTRPGGPCGARSRPRAVDRSCSQGSGGHLRARDARRMGQSSPGGGPDARRLVGTMRAWVSSVRALPMTFVIYLDRGRICSRLGPAGGARVHATLPLRGSDASAQAQWLEYVVALATSRTPGRNLGSVVLARSAGCFRRGFRWHG